MKKLGVIIPAGGAGERMGGGEVSKQFMLLAGRPVLVHAIEAFAGVAQEIVVALPAEHVEIKHKTPPHKVCVGGKTRFESVRNALAVLSDDCDYIAVHDAARPLVSGELIEKTVETAEQYGTAIPATELTDTIRRVSKNGESCGENRAEFVAVQTPQVFRAEILRDSYARATKDDFTDDGSVGFSGFPHQRLQEILQTKTFHAVLCCGAVPMMKAVAGVCSTFGLPCFVSMEERMGCGVGACMVCACSVNGKYSRVCKDGPVFSAEEVDFDGE